MTKNLRVFVAFLFVLLIPFLGMSQKNYFNVSGSDELAKLPGERYNDQISQFSGFKVDNSDLQAFLSTLPQEEEIRFNRNGAPIMLFPMPDGSFTRFRVWESSIQEPELQAKFSEIRTYAGQGIDDPYATVRFDYNPYFGFSAQILSTVTGRIYIDPMVKGNINHVVSYFHINNQRNPEFNCSTISRTPEEEALFSRAFNVQAACRGTTLRTLRTAVACTGEYSQRVASGDPAGTHAAIVAIINRITGVYEIEISVRLVIIANNNLIEYTNSTTDPYNNQASGAQLQVNVNNVNNVIGLANYDIGHLFTTDPGGGIASLGAVCTNNKAAGATGLANPVGDSYAIDFVAHELGHQLGADHTFNSDQCASAGGGAEPGSGTTIMGYAGVCAASHNIQPHSDAMFHGKSYDQISSTLSIRTCGTETNTGNTLPVINSLTPNNLSIPVNTPFALTAVASDANGDAITYCWESWDTGPAGNWTTAGSTTNRTLFRTRIPKPTGTRYFPDMRVIVANYPGIGAPAVMDGLRGEVLATVARQMRFRLTVRDNRAGGGGVVSYGANGCQTPTNFVVNTVGTIPFRVISPNGFENYPGGSTQTITWDVAGTTAAPISVSDVKISLSVDGGLTYPYVISNSTPNDGTESVTIPAVGPISTCRIKVEAIDNIFFDISNNNFTISGATTPSFEFGSTTPVPVNCGAASANISVNTNSISGFNTPIALTYSGNPVGTTVSFAPNPVTPGNSFQVTLNNVNTLSPGTYSFTVTGTAGTIVKTADVSVIVSAGGGPSITTHPASQSICLGGPVTFTASATGATSYQWQVSTDGGNTFNNIGGATTTTYSVPVTTIGMDGYQYHLLANNICGTSTSDNAELTILQAPTILVQPVNSAACVGGSVSFSVIAQNAASYQWQVSTNAGVTWTNVSGATAQTLTLNSVTGALNGNQYHVIVTNSCGSLTSSNVVLSVTSGVNITTQPADVSVCIGRMATFTVVAAGPGLTYQWQISTNGGATWTNISGATSASYSVTPFNMGMNNNRFRVVLSSSCGSPVNSNAAILTVTQGPVITSQPAYLAICEGTTATYSVTATDATGYQWQISLDQGATWTNIPGATNSTLSVPSVTIAMTNSYFRVLVIGCDTPTESDYAVLNVISTPNITQQPEDVSACVDGYVLFSVGGGFIENYQWQVSTDGGSTWTDIVGSISDTLQLNGVIAAMTGNKYRVVVSNHCSATTATSSSATLTIVAGAAITGQPVNTAACAGANASFVVTATGATGYQWQVSTDGGNTWTNISGATSATLSLTSISGSMDNNQYRVVVSGCGPNGINSQPASLAITPVPAITTQPTVVSVCEGTNATYTVTASNATGYQWQVSTDQGSTWTNIPGATNATITIPSVTAAMNNTYYHVLVSGCGSPIESNYATLNVMSIPSISQQPQDVSSCVGGDALLSVGGVSIESYQWQVSTDGGTTWSDIVGSISNTLQLNGVTAAMAGYQYHVVVTNHCSATTVTSSSATLTIVAGAAITGQPTNTEVCAGSNASFTVTATGATGYQWQVSTDGGTTWTDISGATSASLILTSVTGSMNNNQYRAVVSGCGPNGITSQAVTLTITPATTIATHPVDVSACPGANADFSSVATNATGYQWQVSTDGGATWTDVSGETNASLTITGVTAGLNNNKYRVVVSGACGDINSDAATLTIFSAPVISSPPSNIEVCVGEDGSLGVTVSNASSYQWQVSADGGTTWTDIAGATTSTLSLNTVNAGMNNNQYHVIVTGACGQVTSSIAELTVNELPSVVANGPTDVCKGSSITLTGDGAINYTWDNGVTNGASFVINATTTYTVTGIDDNGCKNVATITVQVIALPVITLVASDTELLPGETSTLTATSNPAGVSYVWYRDGVVVPGATGSTLVVSYDEVGSYTVDVVDGNGCSGTSNAVVIVRGTLNYAFITPNANNGIFKVNYPNEGLFVNTRVVTIYDEKGSLIFKKSFPVNFSNTIEVIDISLPHLSGGTYWLMLSEVNGKRLRTGKFIVH